LTDRRAQGGGHCARAIEDGVSEGWSVNNAWPRWSARDASGLSASTIAGLNEVWTDEHERWQKRDLSMKRYVYFWGDDIHLEARLEDQAPCILDHAQN